MRAVVLAGGLGLRLRPYTTVLPKPLVPVGNRPILEHVLRRLAAAGVEHVDLCVSHLGELIRVYFSQAHTIPDELSLAWHWEDTPLGTAGALSSLPDLGGTFIVMNGDVLTTVDFESLLAYHHEREAALTIAMARRSVNVDLGVIVHDDGWVRDYREKPVIPYEVSLGIYVYDERALTHLPSGPCQFPDLVLRLLAAGERVAAYASDADTYDIGTIDELRRASEALEDRPDKFGA